MSIVPDVSTGSLMKEAVKRVRRGSTVYTDKWKGYSVCITSREMEWRYNNKEKDLYTPLLSYMLS